MQVRRWDAETLVNTATWNSSKAIYCIAAEAASPALVAFGGADSAWRLWDSRQDRKQELVSWLDAINTLLAISALCVCLVCVPVPRVCLHCFIIIAAQLTRTTC